jgi:integrase
MSRPILNSAEHTATGQALADNTALAYEKDLRRFCAFLEERARALPCEISDVVDYLQANDDKAISTLRRWSASISRRHQELHAPNPCASIDVRDALRRIANSKDEGPRRVNAAERDEVLAMVKLAPQNLRGVRDRALLLVGFSGMLRRSELAGLLLQKLKFDPRGVLIALGKTKTDRTGEAAPLAIPRAKNKARCPVAALERWIAEAKLWQDEKGRRIKGPVFRRIKKAGKVHTKALNDGTIARLVKAYARKAGLDASLYSGHSLRAGGITTAGKRGKSTQKIMAQSRHKSEAMVRIYTRDNELFEDNAADVMSD